MKKLLIVALCFAAVNANSQGPYYFQRYHNYATSGLAPIQSHSEQFYSGLASRVNYSAPGVTFYVGVGAAYNDNSANPMIAEQARFVRTPANGNANQNYGWEFKPTLPVGSPTLNSNFRSIAERNVAGGSGGYYACGQVTDNANTAATVPGGSDALFMRVNNLGAAVAGATMYKLDFAGGYDVATCIRPSIWSISGVPEYIACGYSTYPQTGTGTPPHTDCWVARIKETGGVVWARRYPFKVGGSAATISMANSLVEDTGGYIFVVGNINNNNPLANDGLIFELDMTGTLIDQKTYDVAAGDDLFQSIKYTASLDLIIGGFTNGASTRYNMLIVKASTALALIGDKILTSTSGGNPIESKCYDIIERINTLNQPEYYLTGPSRILGALPATVIMKANSSLTGTTNWQYAALAYDYGFGIDYNPNLTSTQMGPIVFSNQVGNTFTGGFASSHLLKTAFNLKYCTAVPVNPPITTPTGTTFVTLPAVLPINGATRTLLMALRYPYNKATTCIKANWLATDNVRLAVEEQSEISIYPNPASDFINIDLSESNISQATLTVFDVLGNEVVKTETNSDESNQLDVSKLKTGMYFIFVQSDRNTYKAKFLKQ